MRYGQYVITDSRLQKNIFDITFNYHVEAFTHLNFFDTPTAEAKHDWIHLGHGKENLNVQLRDFNCSGNYILDFDFHCDIFDRTLQDLAVKHFLQVLNSCLENKNQSVQEISILSPAEKETVTLKFNQSPSIRSTDLTIEKLFSQQVSKTPHNIAVVCGENSLTYSQLNLKANQLANYLQSRGLKTGNIVGICLEKSLNAVIAILAVLKAGGTYLPLDPNYPAERLSYMVEDANITLLLTKRSLLPITSDRHTVYLEEEKEAIASHSKDNPHNTITLDNLAYVVYTSGSTGKPKGVSIAHKSLVNAYLAWETAYNLKNVTSHLQMASFSFDVFTGDLVRALCSGGKLVLCPREYLLDSHKLYSAIVKHKIDLAEFVPAVARNLMVYLEDNRCDLSFMKVLIVGSDSWYMKEYRQLKSLCSKDTRVINSYGVSEATIDSTYFEAKEDNNLDPEQLVPIGKPFSNTRIYILDKHLRSVAIGVTGDMYISGVQLAKCYLNKPQLTEERFINTPLGRLYKTGDVARYLPDGNIEFLGRSDNQVKIRGMRIELGEIESILNSHSQIKQAIVVVREERLVSYIVETYHGTSVQGTGNIRNFLKQKLPEYCIPSVFVKLKEFPLTPNGKIDLFEIREAGRKALLKPENIAKCDREYIAPTSKTEKIIAEIFADILNVDRPISIHDDFFELGGHSLLATQVISKVGQALKLDIPLRTVFQCSTIAGLSEAIYKLERSDLAVIKPSPQNSVNIPLSWGQERLYFLQQLEENSPSYNMSTAIKINGELDLVALKRSLNTIISRHEILRTSFTVIEGTPVQKIHPEIEFNLEIIESSEETAKTIEAETQKPFKLDRTPLFRVALLKTSSEESILLLVMHHIISDGWSIGVLIRELTTLYLEYSQDKPSSLEELPVQYADYAVWQRNYLQGKILEDRIDYWKRELANIPPLLDLPTDRSRPPIQTYQGDTFTIKLDRKLSKEIKQLSRRSGTTLYMTLLAAFATLLYRYSQQKDICIGSPIANRNHSEIEESIGFFVNTIVLRSRFENDPTFSELLSQTKRVTLDAYANADLPFGRVVKALNPERNLSHSPLFQVMFMLDKARKDWQLPGIKLSEIKPKSVTAKFDITLSMLETETDLTARWEYKKDLFDRENIVQIANNFLNLLSSIAKNPELKVSQLELLTEKESDRLVSNWNNTEQKYAPNQNIDRLFEKQVELTPEAVAIEFEDRKITYSQLNKRVNKLANYLQKLGVKKEIKVAICLDRSFEMVIGLLAILKAGGAYIPLDPKYPRSRLEYMLEDSQTNILLTEAKFKDNFDNNHLEKICLDTDWQKIEVESDNNLDGKILSENLAYIIYTSGSTGKPKGVEICHKSLTNFLNSMSFEPGIKNSDTMLAITTISFDIAALEIYLPLIVGAKIILANSETAKDGNRLKERLDRNEITVMQGTPATWRSLLAANWQGKKDLKILCGGEKLTSDLAKELLAKSAEVWNLYGPTEATVWATKNKIEANTNNKKIVAIGTPIANTKIYILDKHLKPVPLGVSGELYIGGIQLARGYLNKPELTKARFINSPWGRLYKTGNLARYLKDGTIEYLDRIDNQVKIRGFRIELGEIESILNTHPDIQQAIITVKEERLTAYLVGNIDTKKIREYLKQELPEYMIPSIFVELKEFPLTPNRKIDRIALPQPDGKLTDRREYIPPRNDLERQLVKIWSEILEIKEIGVVDSFFDLGGHSLLAVRLMAQIEQEYGKKIPLTSLFQNPTIETLAKLIQSNTVETNSVLVPIETTGKRSPLFCIHPVDGSIFCYKDLATHLEEYPLYGLQSLGKIGNDTPLTRIEDMASHYIKSIRIIQQNGPYCLAGWSLGGVIALEIAKQLSDMGEKIASLTLIDSHAPNTVKFPQKIEASELVIRLAKDLGKIFDRDFNIAPEEIKNRSLQEQLNYLLEVGQKNKILPSEFSSEKMQQYWEVFQANVMAFSQYKPQKYCGDINLFRAEKNPEIDIHLGWKEIAKSVTTITIPGNHYQIIRSRQLYQCIKNELDLL